MGEPRTEAGKRLAAKLNEIGQMPYSGVSFPDIEDDISDIENEAAAASPGPDLREAAERRVRALLDDAEWFAPQGTYKGTMPIEWTRAVRATAAVIVGAALSATSRTEASGIDPDDPTRVDGDYDGMRAERSEP